MLIRGLIGLCSASLIAASLYTYHSSKIVTPLILILIACLFFNRLFKNWKFVVGWCLVVGFLLLPLAVDSFFGNGADRFQQSTIFRLGLAPLDTVSTLVQHFFIHFAPSYLIHGETETLRHGSGSFGILYVSEFFLIVIGFLGFLFNWIRARSNLIPHVSKLFLFSLAWILVGILPAIIGIDVPHSNRMLLAMPGFLLMAALGWQWIAEKFTDGLVAPSILGMTLLFQVFFVSSYLNHYYTSFSKYSADDFIDGYADTVRYVVQHEDEVDNVIFTSAYQQPYIYTLIGRKTNIYQYHNGALIKYLFPDFITAGDLLRVRALIVATPEEIDPRVGDKLIYGSDGEVRFVIVKTKQ